MKKDNFEELINIINKINKEKWEFFWYNEKEKVDFSNLRIIHIGKLLEYLLDEKIIITNKRIKEEIFYIIYYYFSELFYEKYFIVLEIKKGFNDLLKEKYIFNMFYNLNKKEINNFFKENKIKKDLLRNLIARLNEKININNNNIYLNEISIFLKIIYLIFNEYDIFFKEFQKFLIQKFLKERK